MGLAGMESFLANLSFREADACIEHLRHSAKRSVWVLCCSWAKKRPQLDLQGFQSILQRWHLRENRRSRSIRPAKAVCWDDEATSLSPEEVAVLLDALRLL